MYKPLFTVTGIFAVLLGWVLFLRPDIYLALYVPEVTPGMVFPAQRLSPAIIGLGALMLAARNLPPGDFPSRFAAIGAMVWFGVATTGVFHFATGLATSDILVAAAVEVVLGILFVIAARSHRSV